jgi:hypothetical protein
MVRRAFAAVVAASAAWLLPSLALADVAECVQAHAHGQAERNAGRLASAKAEFVRCSDAACPAEIQSECVAFLAELEVYAATVVFAAVDAHGKDAIDVKVKVDGQQVAGKLTGLAVTLDPGSHTITYVWPDGFEQTEIVMVAQGEKNRRIVLRREAEKVAAPAPAAPAPVEKSSSPVAGYVLGGIGIVALGSFATFAVLGKSAESEMDDCRPYCAQSQADKMRLRYLVADISLGVGLVSLGASGYLLVRASRQPGGSALRGGEVGWGGSF